MKDNICEVYKDDFCDKQCHICKNKTRCKRIIMDYVTVNDIEDFPCSRCSKTQVGSFMSCLCINLKEWYEEKKNLK